MLLCYTYLYGRRDEFLGKYRDHHINPFAADNTLVCGWKLEHAKLITIHIVPRNISSRFSSNSEAFACYGCYSVDREQIIVWNLSSRPLDSKGLN